MAQQVYVTSSLGGYLSVPKLSKELLYQAHPIYKFRQFVSVKEAWGKNAGQVEYFDKVKWISTDSRGGVLTETSTVPRTNIQFTQGTVTIYEYGNAIGYTRFLANVGQIKVTPAIKKALRKDMADVLDRAAATQFQASDVKYVCLTSTSGTLTTNGTAGGTATSNLNAYHVKQIVDQMRKWNVPKYKGEHYICIASVNAIRGLFDDSGWSDWWQYIDNKNALNGEVGKFYDVRFVLDTNVLSNSLGNGSAYGEAVFFGDDAVMEAISEPEHIRVDVPKDFGRDLAIGWFYTGGFQKIWDYSTDGQATIIHVTSA